MSDLRKFGIAEEDFTLYRSEEIGLVTKAKSQSGLVWEHLFGQAGVNSRPEFY